MKTDFRCHCQFVPACASHPENLLVPPPAPSPLQRVLTQHRDGELHAARTSDIDVLSGELAPEERAEVLHLQGLLTLQTEDYLDAIDCIGQAIGLVTNKPACHADLAIALHGSGRNDEALDAFKCGITKPLHHTESRVTGSIGPCNQDHFKTSTAAVCDSHFPMP